MVSTSGLRHEMSRLVGAYNQNADPALSLALFRALGWDGNEYRIEPSKVHGRAGEYCLDARGETTAYLFLSMQEPSEQAIRAAANVAYNSNVDWAAVTNFGVTKVVHSRWANDPTYLTLTCQEYSRRLSDLKLLSPQSLISGGLTVGAQATESARDVVDPIDQHLMSRLALWRRLLLRYSPSVTDQQIHDLIGRLFFIRSCEDRGIISRDTLLLLRDQERSDHTLGHALTQLFSQLATYFDSELFSEPADQPPVFDDTVLSEIIRDLYSPFPGLPHYRYDFSYLNVDVLGKVYERYVSTILVRVPKRGQAQPALFDLGNPDQEVETHSKRREQGIYYTPPYMVNYIVQHTVERLLRDAKSPDEFPLVADISCGSGAFLTRAAERMTARARELDSNRVEGNWGRRTIRLLTGVDLDPRAVSLARVNLWILTTMGEPPRPPPELGRSIFAADALVAPEIDHLKGRLDVVIGNPPFRSGVELDRAVQERLRRRYISATGRFDIAYVFMERALQLVRPGGYIGFVMPNRLFTNTDAQPLRELLASKAVIETVVDFGHEQAFEDGLSYTTILIARRLPQPSDEGVIGAWLADGPSKVQVHRVLHLAEYPGLQLRKADLADGSEHKDDFSHVFTAHQPSGSEPWIWWASDAEDRIRRKLALGAKPLNSIAVSRQGVKTGANDIFLLTRIKANAHTGRWIMQNGLHEQVEMEPDLLRPCVQGESISRYAIDAENVQRPLQYVLYPYADGDILDMFQLQAMFPDTYAYLLSHKEHLASRSTAKNGGKWYDLSRARRKGQTSAKMAADSWLDKPKLLTKVLVREATFAADERGEYIPIGGTVLLPLDPQRVSLYLLLGVLNSSLTTWHLAHRAASFRGGYRQVVGNELMEFQFPWERLESEKELARRVEALAEGAIRSAQLGLPIWEAAAEIDAILFDLVGLNAEEQRAIKEQAAQIPTNARLATHLQGQFDTSATLVQRLTQLDQLLTRAEGANTKRERDDVLIRVRDMILSLLRSPNSDIPRTSTSMLTFALLGAEQLIRVNPSANQVSLLRELVSVSHNDRVEPGMLGRYVRRLREVGIEVLPTMAGASSVMMAGLDSAGDSADPSEIEE